MTALLYAPSLGYGFVYEDLNDPATSFQPWTLAQTTAMPLRSLTRWLDTLCLWAGGGAPWAYHAAGVALHLLNVALLALLAGPFAAALFAVHPLNGETVAYVSARPDLLAATFVLLALLAARRRWWIAAACACFGATLSKESAVVAWLLVPFAAWWEGARVPRWWADVVLAPAMLVLGRVCWNCGASAAWPVRFSLHDSLATATVVVRYVGWTLWPFGLSILHDWSWVTLPVSLWAVAASAVAVVTLRAWFVAAWVALALAPRLLVAYGDGLHDHHWYLPMVGIALALGAWRKGTV